MIGAVAGYSLVTFLQGRVRCCSSCCSNGMDRFLKLRDTEMEMI